MNLAYQIVLAKKGNQQAFRYLLDTFWADVYNFQLKRVVLEDDAEDITIQTFAKAFDKINMYNSSYSFKTWLLTVSKNIAIDSYRSKQSEILEQKSQIPETARNIPDETLSIEDKLIEEQKLTNLLLQIKKLTPTYQQLIQMRFFQAMSHKEIAQKMQISVSSVKVGLMRAKKLLAEMIIQ
ncbi:RNA polymerase sigma factor [Capnocytophaga catalasegens]|uniref:DNA-directed RNA polymerase sigma-70 factor n=1 Tax=Capnocytophaga catalasegens TaxID=1004260 RepID=A0AAV5AUT1_9FLAO|nr:sigma-70 family RNA polymerase sigma factor [Capnocytophaga catalasegens]GIZ15469.1 DNA-directed RNA polymerase sigma-70 factor [Capnocytophaga catalasegens]GJM51057.1 DNA-directed RNA polymerase sigma-70 factor [Capnocytophaga catalasegens]GJM52242.1 DNA-directed RNA polymerase sigma-70 factor [Capnocytophaga catalasegens]